MTVSGGAGESHVGGVAVVKFSVPNVFVVDQQDREGAFRDVRDGTLVILEGSELNAALFGGVRMIVLEQKRDYCATRFVVNVEVSGVGAGWAREREYRNRCKNESDE